MSSEITLSPKPFASFTPEEFHEYVRSLHAIRTKRSAKPKSNGLSWRVNEKGTLIVACRRDWKWILESEMERISTETQIPLNKVFIHLKKKEFTVLRSEAEATEIAAKMKEIPF